MSDSPNRKPGGQPGNHNSRKHGFYAQSGPSFPAIPPHVGQVLDRQVCFLDRLLDKLEVGLDGETTLEQNVILMRTVSLATISTLRVLRARQFNVTVENESMLDTLNRVIQELNEEAGIDPGPPSLLP